uniref:Multidomain signal-transduction protein n=1 Tax=uncultured delta proteobacterium DeepAnt-32C6 TaxID=357895 RepID=Q2I6K9_9DELT|nr:Multidomain signal-transduction protein [uncultured delta proteobacterium DeepAnt-32C6]
MGTELAKTNFFLEEVSCRVCQPLFLHMRQAGVDEGRLYEGLAIDVETLHNPRARMPWDVFAEMCDRAEGLAGPVTGAELLEGHRIIRAIAGLMTNPHLLYKAMNRWFGPSTFRIVEHSCEDLTNNRLRISLTIPPSYRDSPAFFRISGTIFTVFPRLLGQPEAVVQLEIAPRRCVYTIAPPPSRSLLARFRRGLRVFRSGRSVVEELGTQEDQLRASYQGLLQAHAQIKAQAGRLATINTLGRELTRHTELTQLVSTIMDVLRDHAGVNAAELWTRGRDDDSLRLMRTMGTPDTLEGPSESRPLIAGGRPTGRLDLWVKAECRDAVTLSAELTPWIALALENARSFTALEAHRTLLQDKVHALEQAEEALRQSKERYELAVRGSNDGIWDWSLDSGVVHYSTRWKQMLGCELTDVKETIPEWFDRIHPDDLVRVKRLLNKHLSGELPHFEAEHRMRHRDGKYSWMLTRGEAVRHPDGTPYRIAGSQSDITARKIAEDQLRHDAYHDVLCGLANRALFMERLERAIKRLNRRDDYLYAVLFVDLDRFKNINDGLGHLAGDSLLIELSTRLSGYVRETDTLARLGGDEFAVLLEDICSPLDAQRAAQRFQEALTTPFQLKGQEVFVTASIGIALGNRSYSGAEEVLRDADTALFYAKDGGRARHETFQRGMHLRAQARLQLENDLRRSVDRGDFHLVFHPIVDVESCEIAGFEALVRWMHHDRGQVSPEDFIGVCEETGLIIPLGKLVIEGACEAIAEWRQRHPELSPPTISINVSPRQLSAEGLVDDVRHALERWKLAPQLLTLEITESALLDDIDSSIQVLKDLKDLGVGLQIDDFGTGYSSLSYLSQLPIDALKIDRSFLRDMTSDTNQFNIVSAIITLAHSLDLEVTAEGVEHVAQLDELRRLRCNHAQGYYFTTPISSDQACALWRTGLMNPPSPAALPAPSPSAPCSEPGT